MNIFTKAKALTALLTTSVLAIAGTSAAAQDGGGQTLGSTADLITGQLGSIGTLVMSAAFVAGVFFAGVGLMRLKAAVDTQGQQVKYGEGLWRLGLGAGLVALPAVIGIMAGSFGADIGGGSEFLGNGGFGVGN